MNSYKKIIGIISLMTLILLSGCSQEEEMQGISIQNKLDSCKSDCRDYFELEELLYACYGGCINSAIIYAEDSNK